VWRCGGAPCLFTGQNGARKREGQLSETLREAILVETCVRSGTRRKLGPACGPLKRYPVREGGISIKGGGTFGKTQRSLALLAQKNKQREQSMMKREGQSPLHQKGEKNLRRGDKIGGDRIWKGRHLPGAGRFLQKHKIHGGGETTRERTPVSS